MGNFIVDFLRLSVGFGGREYLFEKVIRIFMGIVIIIVNFFYFYL